MNQIGTKCLRNAQNIFKLVSISENEYKETQHDHKTYSAQNKQPK